MTRIEIALVACVLASLAGSIAVLGVNNAEFAGKQALASAQARAVCEEEFPPGPAWLGVSATERDRCLQREDADYPGAAALVWLDQCAEAEGRVGGTIEFCEDLRADQRRRRHDPAPIDGGSGPANR